MNLIEVFARVRRLNRFLINYAVGSNYSVSISHELSSLKLEITRLNEIFKSKCQKSTLLTMATSSAFKCCSRPTELKRLLHNLQTFSSRWKKK